MLYVESMNSFKHGQTNYVLSAKKKHSANPQLCYFLRPKKNDVLGFKICTKKNDVLLNLVCVHVHVGMHKGNRGHLTYLIICPKIHKMTFFLGQRE
jgi:hypothetical protein